MKYWHETYNSFSFSFLFFFLLFVLKGSYIATGTPHGSLPSHPSANSHKPLALERKKNSSRCECHKQEKTNQSSERRENSNLFLYIYFVYINFFLPLSLSLVSSLLYFRVPSFTFWVLRSIEFPVLNVWDGIISIKLCFRIRTFDQETWIVIFCRFPYLFIKHYFNANKF